MAANIGTKALGRSAARTDVAKHWGAIHIWAGTGAFWTVLMIYVYAKWILSGQAVPTPTGVTPVPEYMRINAIVWVTGMALVSAFMFYKLVIQGWQREGRLTLYGMLYIASQMIWFQDSWLNFFSPIFSYNSVLTNWGSWNAFVPFWQSPNAEKMPSPVLFYLAEYPIFFCGSVIVVVALMKKLKARWPQMGNMTLLSITFVTLGVFAVLAEGAWLRTGLYTYIGVASSVTVWPDEAYKIPVLQLFFIDGLVLTTFSSLFYYRDDKGRTFVERGCDQLQAGRGVVTTMRCLAIIGACQMMLFVTYNIPMNFLALLGPGWSPKVLEQSYFTNGVCGDGSDYACPGGYVPAPGKHQIHLAPDGRLVVPEGSSLPQLVKSRTD